MPQSVRPQMFETNGGIPPVMEPKMCYGNSDFSAISCRKEIPEWQQFTGIG